MATMGPGPPGLNDWEIQERALEETHAALGRGGELIPVKRAAAEQRLCADCDLATFAENRLGEVHDPFTLAPATRERWRATAFEAPLRSSWERRFDRCYWIVRDGERVGTLALGTVALGQFANVHSVYVRPPFRGRGIMTATLGTVCAQFVARGLGLRLEVEWTWQKAVRFYLRTGFWLRSWKHALAFVWRPDTPAPIISVGARDASVAVETGGRTVVLARARRRGAQLVHYDEDPGGLEELDDLTWEARTTLALAIALEGWPLVRPGDRWREARYSDGVHPEALADRIQLWEAWVAHHGWRVATPRIPGLTYPTWSDLQEGDEDEEIRDR